ncbi:hypothetical protein GCM10009755_11810 [Brevibacterium samyangense]|uniref:Uncharacterized protein n=2 Tax=Brevibacterium samyangense TaxID=366888 RepID=A0ABN2TCD9_9MICO
MLRIVDRGGPDGLDIRRGGIGDRRRVECRTQDIHRDRRILDRLAYVHLGARPQAVRRRVVQLEWHDRDRCTVPSRFLTLRPRFLTTARNRRRHARPRPVACARARSRRSPHVLERVRDGLQRVVVIVEHDDVVPLPQQRGQGAMVGPTAGRLGGGGSGFDGGGGSRGGARIEDVRDLGQRGAHDVRVDRSVPVPDEEQDGAARPGGEGPVAPERHGLEGEADEDVRPAVEECVERVHTSGLIHAQQPIEDALPGRNARCCSSAATPQHAERTSSMLEDALYDRPAQRREVPMSLPTQAQSSAQSTQVPTPLEPSPATPNPESRSARWAAAAADLASLRDLWPAEVPREFVDPHRISA